MKYRNIVSLLIQKGLTLSVAESFTGGLICHKLTAVPGVSALLEEGIICYSNSSKIKRLGIPRRIIAKYGAVSAQTCRLMAKNIVKSSATDLGLATTGIAGPAPACSRQGGTADKPVGLAYIGINYKGRIIVNKYIFKGSRSAIQQKAAQKALMLLEQVTKRYAG